MLGLTQLLVLLALKNIRKEAGGGTARNIVSLLFEQHNIIITSRQVHVTLGRSRDRGLIEKTHFGYDLTEDGLAAIRDTLKDVKVVNKLNRS